MSKFRSINESKSNLLNWFGNSIVVDNGNPKVCYHGTSNRFDEFNYKYITYGQQFGYGFYFTDNIDVAKGFTETETLLKVYLKIENPISPIQRNISISELTSLISGIDKTGEEFLSDFGDIQHSSYEKILNDAVKTLNANTNDVDLISEIINISGKNFELVFGKLYELGYDGAVINKDNCNYYIVFIPNHIKSVDATKFSDNVNIYK